MKLISPYFEIIEQQPELEGIYRQIELAGRVSHKSEDKITEDSAEKFVKRMIELGHGAVLEHGTVYLTVPYNYYKESYDIKDLAEFYYNNPYSEVVESMNITDGYPSNRQRYYITTNYRVILENERLGDLKYRTSPMPEHLLRVSVKFITSRGITHELVRHRIFSFLQESTRYCNYSQGKFSNELTFIIPNWCDLPEGHYSIDVKEGEVMIPTCQNGYFLRPDEADFLLSLGHSEYSYRLLACGNEGEYQGWKAQQAREVLPNALKSEIIMTGFVSDWWGEYKVYDRKTNKFLYAIPGRNFLEAEKVDRETYRVEEKGFFPLRCSKAAHPQMRELAVPLRAEFIKRNW